MKRELRKLAGLFSERLRTSTCEACNSEFECGASLSGCWCSEVRLTDEARARLKSSYRDCLCPDCLAKAAETEVRQ